MPTTPGPSQDADHGGHARVPARLDVKYADEKVLWGTVRDDLDVEYIVRYRLAKGD